MLLFAHTVSGVGSAAILWSLFDLPCAGVYLTAWLASGLTLRLMRSDARWLS